VYWCFLIPLSFSKLSGVVAAPIGTGLCRWGSRRGHSFSLGLYTMVLQAEMYTVKAYIMEDIVKSYTGRNIHILSDSQGAIKGFNGFKVNAKLVWDCYHFLLKLAET
jgi:hypothetical protein